MPSRSLHSGTAPARRGSSQVRHEADDDALAPIMAGAHARGIADTLEMFGLPAVFLARDGQVLFANRAAQSHLGDALRIRADHLVADDAAGNAALSALVTRAVSDQVETGASAVLHSGTGTSVTVHAVSIAAIAVSGAQLLRVILLLDDGADPAVSNFIGRIGPVLRIGTDTCRAA